MVVHGIPTAEFNNPEGPQRAKQEIEDYNLGLKVLGTPVWLTSGEKRRTQSGGSMLIAFATKEEAQQAIRSRLLIAGISVKAEMARDKPKEGPHLRVQPNSQC